MVIVLKCFGEKPCIDVFPIFSNCKRKARYYSAYAFKEMKFTTSIVQVFSACKDILQSKDSFEKTQKLNVSTWKIDYKEQ